MTSAEKALLDAACEHWISGRFNHLIIAVIQEREAALTETVYVNNDNSLEAGEALAEEDIAAGRVMNFETLAEYKKYLENSGG